jgi:hypothetical protein
VYPAMPLVIAPLLFLILAHIAPGTAVVVLAGAGAVLVLVFIGTVVCLVGACVIGFFEALGEGIGGLITAREPALRKLKRALFLAFLLACVVWIFEGAPVPGIYMERTSANLRYR